MNFRTAAQTGVAVVSLLLCGLVAAPAATISVTYTYTVTASGDPTNPPLLGNGSGAILPLGNMTWSDIAFPNLATGAVTGTFNATFANGTLFGNLFEQADLSAPLNAVPITQTLDVTGGTGAFLGYAGTLTGGGVANLLAFEPSTNTGTGVLNTTPEPGSIALLAIGALSLAACKRFRRRETLI